MTLAPVFFKSSYYHHEKFPQPGQFLFILNELRVFFGQCINFLLQLARSLFEAKQHLQNCQSDRKARNRIR